MNKNYKVFLEGNNGRSKPSTPPPTQPRQTRTDGDKGRGSSSSIPPAKN